MTLPSDLSWIEGLSKCREQSLLEHEEHADTVIQSIISGNDARQPFDKRLHHSYTDLHNHISRRQDRKSKSVIISLSSRNSVCPLRITLEDLQQLVLDEYLDSSFQALIASFGALPKSSEPGFACVTADRHPDGSLLISYLLRFAEEDEEGLWKVRQVGIYHSFDQSQNSHLWILLQAHPVDKDTLSLNLEKLLDSAEGRAAFNSCPAILHELVLKTYLPQWRSYLYFLGRQFAKLSFNIGTVEISPDCTFELTLGSLQKLKNLFERLAPVPAFLDASLRVTKAIETVQRSEFSHNTYSTMHRYQELVYDFKSSVDVLLRQTQNLISLLGSTLDLKNQQDAAQVNQHLLKLTFRTGKDSVAIKVITVVTLLYLPATAIATIFGMNFFNFDSNGIKVCHNIWIYFLALAILTTATMATWRMWVLKELKELKTYEDTAADEKV